MQFTNILSFLLPLLFALGVSAQDDITSVTTYYTTFTLSRVVETTTCTSTSIAPSTTEVSTISTQIPTSSSSTSSTTQLLTPTVQKMVASSSAAPVVVVSSASSMSMVYVPSASAGLPIASTNGTTVATSMPTATAHPYTGAASGLTVQSFAAAAIAAAVGVIAVL